MSSTTPPGWYDDPWGQAAQRFWDGARWTPQTSTGGMPARPRLPDGAPIYGASIWLVALLPLLSAVTIWFVRVDTSALADYISTSQQLSQSGGGTLPGFLNPYSALGTGYPVSMLLNLALDVAFVVLAYRDRQRLARLGVVRPFYWAWAFLGGIVYVIGRSVIVRKVAAPRGLAPMWAAIAVYGACLVSAGIWMAVFVGSIAEQLPAALE